MSWILALALALVAFLVIAFVFKAPAATRLAVGAVLLLGLAGYALQAHPGLAGAPKAPAQDPANESAAMVEARQELSGRPLGPANRWMVIGDALARHGQFADAATVYLGAVEKNSRDGEAWLAMANALVAHADGMLTPAAVLAFREAGEAAPAHPAPPFFYGLALAQSGQLDQARDVWASLLRASPPDAPWRAELTARLSRLDQLIRMRGAR